MSRPLRSVGVLGAGTMGAQIAALFSNQGVSALLLDLPSGDGPRDRLAAEAKQKLSKIRPSPLYTTASLERIEVGNLEDDLDRLADCDWVIEAVIEKLDVKQRLLAGVEAACRPGTLVTTNTSGLSIERIVSKRSPEFRSRFFGTHFFNPPRYMKLLELVPTPDTLPAAVDRVKQLAEDRLGKGVVFAKDTPNFIANRIGAFVSMRILSLMQELGLTVEEVDLITGPLIGLPKTATFRLADLVGVDVLSMVAQNLWRSLKDDEWRRIFQPPATLDEMVKKGLLGRKSGRGFYRKEEDRFLVLDLETFEYRKTQPRQFDSIQQARTAGDPISRIARLTAAEDEAGRFAWQLFRDLFAYSAARIPEITDHFFEVDRAMRWGYNWTLGPFEIWDGLGTSEVCRRMQQEGVTTAPWVEKLLESETSSFYSVSAGRKGFFDLAAAEHKPVPTDPLYLDLVLLSTERPPVMENEEARLLDIGDGVACLEFRGKVNSIGPDTVRLAIHALEKVERDFNGLVIGNQGRDFCVGANLVFLLQALESRDWKAVAAAVAAFQTLVTSFRKAPFPVVAAPFGRTLGGGAEVALRADAVVASAELYMGLVEVGVGLIPAGGGTAEMLARCSEGCQESRNACVAAVRKTFETIGRAKVSSSAEEARRLGFLATADRTEPHPDRVVGRAKQRVGAMLQAGYQSPGDRVLPAVGAAGLSVLRVGIHLMRQAGFISTYDAHIGEKLAVTISGGENPTARRLPEQHFLDLEREAFLSLCGENKTKERIAHTLRTGKPLRN